MYIHTYILYIYIHTFILQGSNNPHVLNTLIEEDCLRRMTAFQRLSAMAEVDEVYSMYVRMYVRMYVCMYICMYICKDFGLAGLK